MRRTAELLVSVAVIPGSFFLIRELQGEGSSEPLKFPVNADTETLVPYQQQRASLPAPAFATVEQSSTTDTSALLSPVVPASPVETANTDNPRSVLPKVPPAPVSLSERAQEAKVPSPSKPRGQPASATPFSQTRAEVPHPSGSGVMDKAMAQVDSPATDSDPLPAMTLREKLSSTTALSGAGEIPIAVLAPDEQSFTTTDHPVAEATPDQTPLASPMLTAVDANGAAECPSSSVAILSDNAQPKALHKGSALTRSARGAVLVVAPVAQPTAALAKDAVPVLAYTMPSDAHFQNTVLKGASTDPDTADIRAAQARVVETTSARLVEIPAITSGSRPLPTPLFGLAHPLVPSALSQAGMDTTSGSNEMVRSRVTTLADAIAAAYASNPRLLSERAVVRATHFALPAARSAYGPQLDVSASLAFTRDRDEILPGTFARNQGFTNTASLILSQPLLTFGRFAAAEGAAEATIAYRREALRVVQNEVILQVISSYTGVIREAGAVTIARENVSLLEKELADARTRFSERDITLTDVQQVESRLSLGRTFLLDAKARLSGQQGSFYSAVGMASGDLSAPQSMPLPVSSLEEAYSMADLRSPLLQAARMRERVSRAQLAQAKAEVRPTVSLQGSADYGSLSDYSNDLRAQRVRGQVTFAMPLFDSGRRSAEVGRAEEANQSDWQLLDAAGRETRADVAAKWTRLQAASGSVEFNRNALQSSLGAYEGAKEQERAGFRTTLELLDLARDLLDVRNRYNAALAEEFVARANLLSAIGVLDPETLSPGLQGYDPQIHLAKVANRGSIPLLNGLLSGIDQIWSPDLVTTRPSRDPAAGAGIAEIDTRN